MCYCNRNTIKSSFRFNRGLKNPDHDLEGEKILTTGSKVGKVIKNVVNPSGEIVGYILSGDGGKNYSIFRSEVLQKIN